jgi:hypothetical protein
MLQLVPIDVECYASYKADETPRRFYLHKMKFEIANIYDRWYQGESSPGFPIANYFKVGIPDGKKFILKHAIAEDMWFLLIQGESIHLSQE